MNTPKALEFAMKQLELLGREDGYTPHCDGDDIYIEFMSGHTLTLDEGEIKYQANEWLGSLISEVEHG